MAAARVNAWRATSADTPSTSNKIRPGLTRHIQYSGDTPLNNLFVTMLNQAGATTDSFNDSTGTLPFLS